MIYGTKFIENKKLIRLLNLLKIWLRNKNGSDDLGGENGLLRGKYLKNWSKCFNCLENYQKN